MAQWWEVAATAATALAAGSLGAWWQGRNSARLFQEQVAEAARVR
ncbi:MAG: hypothetical protein QOI35_1182, partial [Cryptosporangiaceae bacterium]|nr:hypothetical protein [Cryptosporangiaceae bacterium]